MEAARKLTGRSEVPCKRPRFQTFDLLCSSLVWRVENPHSCEGSPPLCRDTVVYEGTSSFQSHDVGFVWTIQLRNIVVKWLLTFSPEQ